MTGRTALALSIFFFTLPATAQMNRPPQADIVGPGIISTGDYDTHPTLSPSGDTLVFLKGSPDFNLWTICISYRLNGVWTQPIVADFSGEYIDADPFFSQDGRTLYFISDRPAPGRDSSRTDWDIWKIEKTGIGWSTPVRLDGPVNSAEDEYYPTVAANGTLYFGSARAGGKGGSDIYRCRFVGGRYAQAENLGDSINTAENEYEPFIAPDESFLLFVATHPDGLRHADIYLSRNRNGVWTHSTRLPSPVNSDGQEFSPKITWDGKYFLFSSTRNINPMHSAVRKNMKGLRSVIAGPGNGLGDIYRMTMHDLRNILDGIK